MADQSSPEAGEPRFTLSQRIQLTLVSWIVPALLRLIGCTLRETTTYEEGAIQSLDEVYPGIFPFWHRCVLPATWLYRHKHPAVMTSQSRDGEFIARVIQPLRLRAGSRIELTRWSTSAAGDESSCWQKETLLPSPSTARAGHADVAKKGPVLLARMSGAAITAFYVAVERAWVLNTWDRLVIPKPFSRIYVRFAKKIFVPPDADEAAMERYHAEMQAALDRITEFADEQFSDTRN